MNTTNIEIVVDPYSKYSADHLKESLPGLKGMVVKGDPCRQIRIVKLGRF